VAIPSATTVTIPAGIDQLAFGLHVTAQLLPAGVTGSGVLSRQRYRADSDGTNPLEIGKPITLSYPDVYAAAAADPDVATLVGEVQASVAKFFAAKGY
jgi:hypothetical protein